MGRRQVAHGDLPQRRAGTRGLERRDVNYNAATIYSLSFWRLVMIRARFAVATIVGASFVALVSAQTPAPPRPR